MVVIAIRLGATFFQIQCRRRRQRNGTQLETDGETGPGRNAWWNNVVAYAPARRTDLVDSRFAVASFCKFLAADRGTDCFYKNRECVFA